MKNNKWRFNLYSDSDRIAFEEYLCEQEYDEKLDDLLVAFGRKERAMQRQDMRWLSLFALREETIQAYSPEECIIKDAQDQFIRECVNGLPPIQRKRVLMHYWMGLSQQQIAEVERVSVAAISYSIKYARKNIVNKLLTLNNRLNF